MSDYSSSGEASERSDLKGKGLFANEWSLISLSQSVEEWMSSCKLPNNIEYLSAEVAIFRQSANWLRSAYQLRIIAFCEILRQQLSNLAGQYRQAYAGYHESQAPEARNHQLSLLLPQIDAADSKLKLLLHYLHMLEMNETINYFIDLYPNKTAELYRDIKECLLYCLDLETLWLAMLAPRMYREEEAGQIYKTSLGSTQKYYDSKIKHIKANRDFKPEHFVVPANRLQLIRKLCGVFNCSSPSRKLEYAFLIKGQFYCNHCRNPHALRMGSGDGEMQLLLHQFFLASLNMYHCYEISETWNYSNYEQLCYLLLHKCRSNPQLIGCMLYMEPEQIGTEHRQHTKKFFAILDEILSEILSLDSISKQHPPNSGPLSAEEQCNLAFLHQILTDEKITVFMPFLVSFANANADVYSIDDCQLHKLYLGVIDKMHRIYLSFGQSNRWVCGTSVLVELNHKFFTRMSQESHKQLQTIINQMVINLVQDELPARLRVAKSQNQSFCIKLEKVDRLDYIIAIFSYIQDYLSKESDAYVELPQIFPVDFPTAFLFVRSLELKLKYHEPSQEQRAEYIQKLDICHNEYKINITYSWYLQQHQDECVNFSICDREQEFALHRQLGTMWSQRVLQDVLNYRDSKINDLMILSSNRNNYLTTTMIPYMKYALGLELSASRYASIQEEQLFYYMEEIMRSLMIPQNYFASPHLCISLEEEVGINYSHICLQLYNTVVQEADESQIYGMIVQRVIIPWMKCEDRETSRDFKKRFPHFFNHYLMAGHYLELCGSMVDYIIDRESAEGDRAAYTQNLWHKIEFLSEGKKNYLAEKESAGELVMKVVSILHASMESQVLYCLYKFLFYLTLCQEQLKEQFELIILINYFIDKVQNLEELLKRDTTATYHQSLSESIQSDLVAKLPELMQSHQIGLKAVQTVMRFSSFSAHKIRQSSQMIMSSIVVNDHQISHESKYWLVLRLAAATHCYLSTGKDQQEEGGAYLQKLHSLVQAEASKIFLQDIKESNAQQNASEINLRDLLSPYKQMLTQQITQHRLRKNATAVSKKEVNGTDVQINGTSAIADEVWSSWTSIIARVGSPTDISLMGVDPLEYVQHRITGDPKSDAQICENLIHQSTTLCKFFKKVVSKTAAFQKVALNLISAQKITISPQTIHKLILINAQYPNPEIEAFLLRNIGHIDGSVGIKIYQQYLVDHIKDKLRSLPANFAVRILYEHDYELLEHCNELFKKIQCLPLLTFENAMQKEPKPEHRGNGHEEDENWQTESESSEQPSLKHSFESDSLSIRSESVLSDQSNSTSLYDSEEQPPIAKLFFSEEKTHLHSMYKELMEIREQINLTVNDNFCRLEQYANNPDFVSQLKQCVKILNLMSEQGHRGEEGEDSEVNDIMESILSKFPVSLLTALRSYELAIDEELLEKVTENSHSEKKQNKKLPVFLSNYLDSEQSSSDFSSESNGEREDQDDETYLEKQSEAWADQSQLSSQDRQSQQGEGFSAVQLQLPELREVDSKVESMLSGKQLDEQEFIKILEISIIRLLTMTPSELKIASLSKYYQELSKSKVYKTFIDTFITVLRIHENLEREPRAQIERKYHEMGISLKIATRAFLGFLGDCSQEEKEMFVSDECQLLPLGDQVMIRSDLRIQDNIVTLFVLYTKYKEEGIRIRLESALIDLISGSRGHDSSMSRRTIKIIAKHAYKNNCSCSLWEYFQNTLNLEVSYCHQLECCATVYCPLLRKDIEKIVSSRLLADREKADSEFSYHDQERIAANIFWTLSSKIRHFCDWLKKCLANGKFGDRRTEMRNLLSSPELIKIGELVAFYLKSVKTKFAEKSDQETLNKILYLPAKILKSLLSIMHKVREFQKLPSGQTKWQPLSKVQEFFRVCTYGQYKFKNLEEISNLLLQFTDMPFFASSRYKEILMPYLIRFPESSRDICLMFKAPHVPDSLEGNRIYVTRQCSFDMTFYQLKGDSFLIEFHEEEGSDHGGMVKELMMGWQGVGVGEEYFFLGKLLAISFQNSIPYGGKLDLAMAIAVTQFKPSLDLLKDNDPALYQSLKYIEENDPEDLELIFVYEKEELGRVHHYPMIVNGDVIPVTQLNKKDYIERYVGHHYSAGREWELGELQKGFYSVVNSSYASLFHPHEIIQQIRGKEVTDYRQLRDHAKYEEGYTRNSMVVKWFWEIVAKFNQQQMNKFLQFLTGTPRVSLYDPQFSVVISKTYEEDQKRLPVAHTCFNTLDLPDYSSKQLLEDKLKTAIFEGNDNFGIL